MRVNYYGQELRTNIQICMNIQRRRRGLCNILLYDTRTFCVRLYVERKKEKRKEGITEKTCYCCSIWKQITRYGIYEYGIRKFWKSDGLLCFHHVWIGENIYIHTHVCMYILIYMGQSMHLVALEHTCMIGMRFRSMKSLEGLAPVNSYNKNVKLLQIRMGIYSTRYTKMYISVYLRNSSSLLNMICEKYHLINITK